MLSDVNLMLCAASGELKKIQYLLQNGANINYLNAWGENALITAIQIKNIEIAKFLIENGIDVNAKSVVGDTPLSMAKENNFYEMVNYLITNGAKE